MKLLAATGRSLVVPPGVVMVTTRGVAGALAAMLTATVASIPSLETAGGLTTVMPSAGTNSTLVAPERSLPLTERVKLLPFSRRIGVIPYSAGSGRVTRKRSAPARAGSARPVAVFRIATRAVSGAPASMETRASR